VVHQSRAQQGLIPAAPIARSRRDRSDARIAA